MKTLRISMALGFLLFTLNGTAQFAGFGVGGGGTASTFKYGNQVRVVEEFESEDKVGGTGGIKFDFNLGTEYLKLTPEFFLIQNGSTEYYSSIQDVINRNVKLDYIGFYLPLTFYIPLDNGQGITEEAYHGILINASGFIDYVINAEIDNGLEQNTAITFREDANKVDFGFSINAGFVFNGIFLKFGYDHGLKNIEFQDALGDLEDENYLINNRGFTLTAGYLYKFGH